MKRQEAYNAMLRGMMQDLANISTKAIHDHLQDFVVTAPVIG